MGRVRPKDADKNCHFWPGSKTEWKSKRKYVDLGENCLISESKFRNVFETYIEKAEEIDKNGKNRKISASARSRRAPQHLPQTKKIQKIALLQIAPPFL